MNTLQISIRLRYLITQTLLFFYYHSCELIFIRSIVIKGNRTIYIPLFYFCRVKDDPVSLCVYWLSAEYFIFEDGSPLKRRPIGKTILPTKKQRKRMKRYLAKTSMLERISSLGSIYYILFGVFTGIFRAVGSCLSADWPYLSLSISWAVLPIIMKIY